MLKLKAKDRRPQDTAFGECLERVQSRRIDEAIPADLSTRAFATPRVAALFFLT
jgi:hypothetical protein